MAVRGAKETAKSRIESAYMMQIDVHFLCAKIATKSGSSMTLQMTCAAIGAPIECVLMYKAAAYMPNRNV